MNDRIGQLFGNYRLLRLLGSGGFADVYLGEHRQLNTYAAIKILHTRMSAVDIERFRNEARTIAHLLHPSIVRVFDFDVKENIPFLVMDYQPNGTLRDRHSQDMPVPLTTVNAYVQQIADALQYAHDEKLIHRDIKPENMLVGRRNEVLLSDFGIAAIAHNTSTQRTQDRAGTISYMAPEQIQGRPRPASDQYALGIITYEWLSGNPPFSGDYVQLMYQQLQVAPPPLREQVPTLPPAVEQVVMRALDKDPQRRFANVQEFAQAFNQACQSRALPPKREQYPPAPPPATNAYSQVAYSPQIQTPQRVTRQASYRPAMRRSRAGITLLLITIAILVLGVALLIHSSIIRIGNYPLTPTSIIIYLIVAAIVGFIARSIVRLKPPFGIIGEIIAAFVGIWLLTRVIIITGLPDIFIYGIPIIRALIGAITFVALWHLIAGFWNRLRD